MAIDPPVKTKITVDPDTGARVFNQSWSSELKKKQPIQRKPVSRDTFVTEKKVVAKPSVKPVAKETTVKSSGGRKFNEVISPSPAKAVGMDLKGNNDISKRAPIKTESSEDFRKRNLRFSNDLRRKEDEENLLKNYPGKTLKQAYEQREKNRDRAIRKSNRSVKDQGGFFSNEKQRSASCTSC